MISQHSTDEALWEAITRDDIKAYTLLFDRYWSQIFTTAFSYHKNREACMEIVHDIFLNLWTKRAQLKITSFKAYLSAAARYHVYRKLKELRMTPVDLVVDLEDLNLKVGYNDGDKKVRYQELEQRIDIYLQQLPKRCREIFIMSRRQHLSNDEISVRLQISKRTVENQLTQALLHLRNSLKDLTILLILCDFFKNII